MSAGPSWDDTEPVEQSGPSWDETEPVEGWADLPSHIIPNAAAVGKSLLKPWPSQQMGMAKSIAEKAIIEKATNGTNPAVTMVKGIAQPFIDLTSKEKWINQPVSNAITAAPLVLSAKGYMERQAPIQNKVMPPAAEVASQSGQRMVAEAPPVGAEPPPIPKAAPEPPPAAAKGPIDPLQDVKDFLKRTQAKAEAVPGWQEKAAKYVKNEVADFRAKDIGMRDPMIRSLDPKRPLQALQKAEDLMDYAGEKGYFRPGLTDVARKDAIASTIEKTGANIGAVRQIAGKRGTPPIAEIRKAILDELTAEYGEKATREIKTVLSDFDRKVKENPTYQGMADLATYLNQEKKTFNKIGQNEGPTTDAANIVSRMNNDSLRSVLSPAENKFYTENLRDFGAHKKLEQMVASSGRRAMTGRGAPGGAFSAIWQQLWDRGGYRMAGDVANRVSSSVLKNPGRIKSLPEFFEELAHHSGESFDELIGGMWQGGEVPEDVAQWVTSKNK